MSENFDINTGVKTDISGLTACAVAFGAAAMGSSFKLIVIYGVLGFLVGGLLGYAGLQWAFVGAIFAIISVLVNCTGSSNNPQSVKQTGEVGEIHKEQTQQQACRIGIVLKDLQYFYYNNTKFQYGVEIVSVVDDMPAKSIGLQPGDVLYLIDSSKIQNRSFLESYINNTPCLTHNIYYLRNNTLHTSVTTPVLR